MPDAKQDLLDQFETYLDKGTTAWNGGNRPRAREYFIAAAERLFEIAELSTGELQEIRIQKADDLLTLAEQIDLEIVQDKKSTQQTNLSKKDTPIKPAPPTNIKLADVAGLEEVKDLIRDKLIDPSRMQDLYEEFGTKTGGGILLYGPPGTGKTYIAKAIAGEIEAPLFTLSPGEIMSKWVGEPEKNIRKLFATAAEAERAVIFIDELDALAPGRENADGYMRRLVNQLLTELDGFSEKKNILFIGATNYPQLIDHALLRPGRLDNLVYVPLPGDEARKSLWKIHLGKIQRAGTFDFKKLAELSNGYSGAEITHAVDKASQMALNRYKKGNESSQVEMQDLEHVLSILSPQTQQKQIHALERFGNSRDFPNGTPESGSDHAPLSATNFTPHPSGIELEHLLEGLLSPFPQDPGLVPMLASLYRDRHITDIYAKVAETVHQQYGHLSGKEEHADFQLSLVNFVDTLQANEIYHTASMTAKEPNPSPGSGDDGKRFDMENSDLDPESLTMGMDILDRYRADLSTETVEALTDRLYGLATKGTIFDTVAFEGEILIHLKQPKPENSNLDTERAYDGVLREREVSNDDRHAAMALLHAHMDTLEERDVLGLIEEIQNNSIIDFSEFESRIKRLSRIRTQELQIQTLEHLLADRRNFLEPQEISGFESRIKDENANFPELIEELNQKTYNRKLEDLVSAVIDKQSLPRNEGNRVKRKTIRQIQKTGIVPGEDAVRSRVRAIVSQVREFSARNKLAEDEDTHAPVIDSVDKLIVRNCPYDFSDLGGMDNLKTKMENAIEVWASPERLAKYRDVTGKNPRSPSMLLYGAPGCGKTFLAMCAAGEFSQRFGFTILHVPTRAVTGLHHSKHCPRIAEIFNLARKNAPSIVIWDEFDGIAESNYYSGRKHQVSVCNELKTQFEGVKKSGDMIIHIATSNNPWNLDQAMLRPGRLENKIHVLPPDTTARREILELETEGASAARELDLDQVATWTENMTTAELCHLVTEALSSKGTLATMNPHETDPLLQMGELEVMIKSNPPTGFAGWLRQAGRILNLPKYESQKDFFPDLLKDVNQYLHQNDGS